MKKKYQIIFEVEAEYPEIEKELKYLNKQLISWIKDTCTYQEFLVPTLYHISKNGGHEYSSKAKVKVKAKLGNKKILDKTWYEKSK